MFGPGRDPDRDEKSRGQDGDGLKAEIELGHRVVLGLVDAGHVVELGGDFRIQVAHPDGLPRLHVRLPVVPEGIDEEADAQAVLLLRNRALGREMGQAARAERLDGLDQEVDGDTRVDREVEVEPELQVGREARNHLGPRSQDDDGGIERAHDDEREPGLVVGEIDEVLGFLERVELRLVALPGVSPFELLLLLLLLLVLLFVLFLLFVLPLLPVLLLLVLLLPRRILRGRLLALAFAGRGRKDQRRRGRWRGCYRGRLGFRNQARLALGMSLGIGRGVSGDHSRPGVVHRIRQMWPGEIRRPSRSRIR